MHIRMKLLDLFGRYVKMGTDFSVISTPFKVCQPMKQSPLLGLMSHLDTAVQMTTTMVHWNRSPWGPSIMGEVVRMVVMDAWILQIVLDMRKLYGKVPLFIESEYLEYMLLCLYIVAQYCEGWKWNKDRENALPLSLRWRWKDVKVNFKKGNFIFVHQSIKGWGWTIWHRLHYVQGIPISWQWFVRVVCTNFSFWKFFENRHLAKKSITNYFHLCNTMSE